jgi:hypothetical protein
VFEASQLPEALKDEDGNPARLSYDGGPEGGRRRDGEALEAARLRDDKKGGVHADELAPLFGFKDGKEMLETLSAGVPDMARRSRADGAPVRRDLRAEARGAGRRPARGRQGRHAQPGRHPRGLLVRGMLARGSGRRCAASSRARRSRHERAAHHSRHARQELSPKHYLDSERRREGAFDLMGEAKRAREGARSSTRLLGSTARPCTSGTRSSSRSSFGATPRARSTRSAPQRRA